MTNAKQRLLLACALVLTLGLMSCSSDKNNSAQTAGPTGMLVHSPVIVTKDGKTTNISGVESGQTVSLNLDDQVKLTPVLANGKGLTTVQVQSTCSVLNQPLGTDSVTLPYQQEYTAVQFFTGKTLVNDVWGGATELNCSMHFTVNSVNGSTHSFSISNLQLNTEDSSNQTVQIFDVDRALSDYDGFLRMDYNHLDQYLIQIQGIDYRNANLVCETNAATIDKNLMGSPLYGLRFSARGRADADLAAQKYSSQQFCRLLVYRGDSTVVAASNLILMTMSEPQFSLLKAGTNFPNLMKSHNIFDYTWRNYVVTNNGTQTLYFAIPPVAGNTVDFENVLFKDGSYVWAQTKVPTQILVHGSSNVIDGVTVFAVAPSQSVDIGLSAIPHDFVCDQWRVPVMYSVSYDAKEIPIYQIKNPSLSLAVDNILHSERLEKRYSNTVTDSTFGDNNEYGNHCRRISGGQWIGCYSGRSPAPVPMTAANRADTMCVRVD